MTTNDTFERQLAGWLIEDSTHRVPDHLNEVLLRTVATRQRPWWSSARRWLPMDLTAPRAVLIPSRSLRSILILAAVALVVAALIIFAAGSRRPPLPPPFGLARNGIVITAVNGDLFSVDPKTGAKTPLVSNSPDEVDFGPGFSRDGTKISYVRSVIGGQQLVVANPDGRDAHSVSPVMEAIDQADWSPDGSRIVVLSRVLGVGQIHVVATDRSGLDTTIVLPFPANQVSWLAPNGDEILFRGEHLVDKDPPPGIFAIGPDGRGLRSLSTRPATNPADYQDISGSPDGTKLLYREDGQTGQFRIHVLDLRTGEDDVLPAPADARGQTSAVFSPNGVQVAYLRIAAEARPNGSALFQLVVAPLDGSTTGTELPLLGIQGDDGPTINNYFFTPDGSAVVANDLTNRFEWLLPIDGSPGTVIARGTAPYDALSSVQRLAP
jgi:Tol biopolymer transport system component